MIVILLGQGSWHLYCSASTVYDWWVNITSASYLVTFTIMDYIICSDCKTILKSVLQCKTVLCMWVTVLLLQAVHESSNRSFLSDWNLEQLWIYSTEWKKQGGRENGGEKLKYCNCVCKLLYYFKFKTIWSLYIQTMNIGSISLHQRL